MFQYRKLSFVGILFLGLCAIKPVSVEAQINSSPDFSFIIGNWENKTGNALFSETWSQQTDELLTGFGFQIVSGDTSFSEILRIQKIANHWAYIPVVNGGAPVLFTLTHHDTGEFRFENKEHDFPQVIHYKQTSSDTIVAETSGLVNGKIESENFYLVRKKD